MSVGKEHQYQVAVRWTGDRGSGTSHYRHYGRDHLITSAGRPEIPGSADPAFRGDTDRWNPEQFLLTSLSQCHLLWYLHLAAQAGIVVVEYSDDALGVMFEDAVGGGGQFASVTLRPSVVVTKAWMIDRAVKLHGEVGVKCFIARSVNFPVHHQPTVTAAG